MMTANETSILTGSAETVYVCVCVCVCVEMKLYECLNDNTVGIMSGNAVALPMLNS